MSMNVLSLFDGISCGRLALSRAGIPVDKYFASEIDRAAMAISRAHWPDIVQVGDITAVQWDKHSMPSIDLLIGGSPCTDFSSIGYARGMVSSRIELTSLGTYLDLKASGARFEGQSYLFWEYVRILEESQPRYFLLENVLMANRWRDVITNALGVEPVLVNSSVVSAQNRPRLYWTNIPVGDICNRNVTLDDIMDEDACCADVSDCLTVQRSLPRLFHKYGYIPSRFNAYNASEIFDKAPALSRGSMVTSSCATLLFVPVEGGKHLVEGGILDGNYPTQLADGEYNLRRLSLVEMERLQTLTDAYTDVRGVGTTKRSAAIGNGWTVDVISAILRGIA